jgi:sec-independent protein translocase protein TatC
MILYYKYYLEIKNRILLLFVTWISLLVVCYYFKEPLLFVFINSNTYYNELNNLSYFIFTDVREIFYVYLQLMFFIANQITICMLFYHSLMFFALGLYNSEFIQLQSTFKLFITVWLLSVILLKEFVVPFSGSFFLSFQNTNYSLQPTSFFFEARIVEYLNYFINLYYICLINCQMLALLTLVVNHVSERKKIIQSFRKLFYFLLVVFSTLTTPPDVASQIIVSLSLIIMYELLIFTKYLKP